MTKSTKDAQAHMHLLAAVLDSSPYIIQVFDAIRNPAGDIIDFVWTMNNQKGVEQNGDVIGKSLLEQNPGVLATGIFEAMKQVTNTGISSTREIEYRYEQFDGWFRQSLVKLNDGVVMNTENITELKASKNLVQTVFEVASNPMAYHMAIRDDQGKITDFEFQLENKVARKYANRDRTGQKFSDAYPGIKETPVFQMYCDVVDTGISLDTEIQLQLKGKGRWFHLTAVKLGNGLVASAVDISTRKNAEKEILDLKDEVARTLTDKYYSLFNAIDDGFCIYELLYDLKGEAYDLKWIEVNPAYKSQTGLKDMVGKRHSELLPGTQKYWLKIFDQVISIGEGVRFEHQDVPTGRWYQVLASPVGKTARRQVAVVFEDVTERKHREQQQDYLLRLQDALGPLVDPVAIQQVSMQLLGKELKADRVVYADVEGEEFILNDNYVGKGVEKLVGRFPFAAFGASVDQLKKGIAVITPDMSIEAYDDLEKQNFLAVGVQAVLAVPIIKNGKFLGNLSIHHQTARDWKDDEIALTRDTAERIWTAVERAKAERALRKSEEKYRTIFENIDEAFVLIELLFDEHGNVKDFIYLEENPKHALTSGLSKVIGKRASELFPVLEAQWLSAFQKVYETGEAIRGEEYNGDTNRWYRFYHSRVGGPRSPLIATVSLETTEQKRREQHQAFILNFSDRLRKELSPDAVANCALQMMTDYLQLDRSCIVSYYLDDNRAVLDYQIGNQTVPPLPQTFDLSHYPKAFKAVLDQTLVIEDELEREGLSEAEKQTSGKLGMRAMVAATLRKGYHAPLWSMMSISSQPRRWRADEVQLIEEIAERTWMALDRIKVERDVQHSRERFQSIANLVPDLLWDSEPDGSTNWYNERWLAYTGQSFEEAVGWGWVDAIHPDDRKASASRYAEAAKAGKDLQQEHRIKRYDGIYRWFVVNVSPVKAANGQVIKMYGSATDIHDRRMAEEALRKSEATLAAAFRSIPVGIGVVDTAGKVIISNTEFNRFLPAGKILPQDQMNAERWKAWDLNGKSLSVEDYPSARALRGESVIPGQEMLYKDDEGNQIWTSVSTVSTHNEHGEIIGIISVINNIDRLKRSSEALRESEERFRTLTQTSPVGIAVSSLDGRIIYVNKAYASMLNYRPEELLQKPSTLVYYEPGERQAWLDEMDGSNTLSNLEVRFRRKDGGPVWVSISVAPVEYGGQKAIIGVVINIDDHKRTATALQEAELKYRTRLEQDVKERTIELQQNRELLQATLDSNLEMIQVFQAVRDKEGRVIDFIWILNNHASEQLYGDVVGKSLLTYNPGVKTEGIFDAFVEVTESGIPQQYEKKYHHEQFEGWFKQSVVKLNDGVATTTLNITDRKQAELQLKENRDQLQSILDTTLVQMSILKAIRNNNQQIVDLEIVAVNKQLERVTGRSDLIGKRYATEYPGIRQAGLFDLIRKAIETGQPQASEYLYSYDGFDEWFSCAFVKLNDGVVATNMNITDRKRAEQERLKNYMLLKQSEDLALLGSWDYDIKSKTFSWSEGMYRLFGIEKGTWIEPEIYLEYSTKAARRAARKLVRHIRTGDADFEETIELTIAKKVKVIHLKGAVIRDEDGMALRVLGVDMDITAMRLAQQKIRNMEAEQQLEIFRVSLDTVEEERHRISESLHNGIGQLLYAIKINLSGFIYGGEQEEFIETKTYISKLLTEAIVETRRISHELMPTTLEKFGLKSAIDDVCLQLSGKTIFNCQITGLKGRIEKFLELAVYRTVQELMTNVAKHAHASTCDLKVHISEAQIMIRISDDGQGMANKGKAKPGIGLASIRSKVRLLNGRVSMDSVVDHGTKIEVIIPRKKSKTVKVK